MADVFQSRLPYDPTPRALPGIQPLDMADWLHFDEAFAGQMAERDRLVAEKRQAVIALDEPARPAAEELLSLVLELAYPGAADRVRRRDGVRVRIDRADPMGTLGRLVQEDLLILQKQGDAAEHILTAAVLCFPASWSLAEKFLQPLTTIHVPVPSYDDNIARRVQRLFDGVRPERPLWRYNALWYDTPELHLPQRRPETDRTRSRLYLRSERQCILRLPQTGAAVFSVHTYLIPAARVPGGSDRQD